MLERPPHIPTESGVYLFRNDQGVVIYVGKALSLASRIPNYFAKPGPLDLKTPPLMKEAASVEWVVTHSEVDALILENELIKTHQPRYNSRLKDDKSFPFLALDFRSPFPHPYTTRATHAKGVRYYGPFAHVGPLKRTIDELLQAFPLRSCTNAKFDQHKRMGRPCLLFDVGKCVGPCVGLVDEAEYAGLVASFGAFFDGRVRDLRTSLEERMETAAREQRYEVAARARDGLVALERAAQGQRVVLDESSHLDAIAIATSGSRAALCCHRVRDGRVVGRHAVLVDLSMEDRPIDVLERALPELYRTAEDVPPTLLVGEDVTPTDTVAGYLARVRDGRVAVAAPQRGKRRALLELVTSDAVGVLESDSTRRTHDHNVRSRALSELGAALSLAAPPYRIECFDMSHLQGTNYVGSMVVFEDGLPKKRDYRHFNVKTVLGNDDAGAMREVVGRRLSHWNDAGGDDKFTNADLIIIDGGLPQLSAAIAAAEGAPSVPAGSNWSPWPNARSCSTDRETRCRSCSTAAARRSTSSSGCVTRRTASPSRFTAPSVGAPWCTRPSTVCRDSGARGATRCWRTSGRSRRSPARPSTSSGPHRDCLTPWGARSTITCTQARRRASCGRVSSERDPARHRNERSRSLDGVGEPGGSRLVRGRQPAGRPHSARE